MKRTKSAGITAVLFLIITCAGYAQSLGNSKAAADDAAKRLEQALGGGGASVKTAKGGTEPNWVKDPYAAYSRDRYLAARGFASTQGEAEKKALAALVSIFGVSVQSNWEGINTYHEAASNNVITFSENTSINEAIRTAASMDTLIGAEIGNIWDNARGTVYALAYIERKKAIAVYSEMIRINQINIENLTALNDSEKNTFDGYARYKLAALIAELNSQYAAVIVQSGGSTVPLNMTSAGSLNIEAENIIKNITVAVNVKGDKNNRIKDAFSKIISAEGIRTQGNAPVYTLDINVNLDEVVIANSNYKWYSLTLNANLIENKSHAELLPYNYSDRAGHTSLAGAENTAFILMERDINDKYKNTFKEYLAGLFPKR